MLAGESIEEEKDYYTFIYQPRRYNKCWILYNLSREKYIEMDPATEDNHIFHFLCTIAPFNNFQLILFDNLIDIDIEKCKIMTALGIEFVIFSTQKSFDRFELANCPLTNENGIIKNKNGLYRDYFERIEMLENKMNFAEFEFLVESKGFADRFILQDQKQIEGRYRNLLEGLGDFEKLPNTLNEYGEDFKKMGQAGPFEIHQIIRFFGNLMKKKMMCKPIDFTVEYFIETYVLASPNYKDFF